MLQPTTVARIQTLLPLLSSDKPGEVVATVAAIDRALKVTGNDWHDFTAHFSRRQRTDVDVLTEMFFGFFQ